VKAAIPARWMAETSAESTPEEIKRERFNLEVAKRCAEKLYLHYPRHHFRIGVDTEGGIVTIAHPLLPATISYVIKFRDLTEHALMVAGGELLERFNLSRGEFNRDKWREASKKHRRTALGLFPHEVNMRTGHVRKILPGELA
jgi:hypothetical protein